MNLTINLYCYLEKIQSFKSKFLNKLIYSFTLAVALNKKYKLKMKTSMRNIVKDEKLYINL